MKKKVLTLLLTLVMIFTFASCGSDDSQARQDSYNLKFSIAGSEAIPMNQLWQEYADKITEATDGQVEFTFYFDSTLLEANSAYAQLVSGIADIGDIHRYASDGFNILEKWKGLTMGTPVEAQVDMAKQLFEDFPELQEEISGVHSLAFAFDGGTYNLLTTDTPVESVDDMKGLVIWCEADFNDFIEGLGATPVNTPWSEVYSSLQKNMYDGLLIAAETLESSNFAEVCSYVTMIDLNYLAAPGHFMNLDTWNSLPEDIQAVFNDPEIVGFIEDEREAISHSTDADSIAWAQENYGTTVIELDDATRQEFIDVLNESKKNIAAEFDSQGLPGTELLEAIEKYSKEYE